jgi:L-sorbose 1-phosphate reductase
MTNPPSRAGGADQPATSLPATQRIAAELPATQRAVQFVAADQVLLNPAKPVPELLPTQLLVKVEAVGICFSDTKLLHAFTAHPRKGPVLSGIDPAVLAEIPSYVPGNAPTVPGHEVCGRIVAVGSAVSRHRVGERVLVQTDYRHLPTDGANASFGYTFEGGLQEYVLMDERVIIEPDTGERFLIPVDEVPSASAVALLEPWACVERAYATEERGNLMPGGRLLVVAETGRTIEGLAGLVVADAPGQVTVLATDESQRSAVEAALADAAASVPVDAAAELAALPVASFDDIVYFGSEAGRIEELERRLAPRGVIDVVLGGEVPARAVEVDVGRIHYDLVRWVGTTGSAAAEGYAMAPGIAELRDGERVVVIGAAGPMGFMHVIRALTSDRADLDVTAVDIDPARLEHLAAVAEPIAAANRVAFRVVDSRETQLDPGFTRVGVMVPSPALAADAVRLAGDGAILDIFAGFAVGTRAPLDLGELIRKRVYMIGTSGSVISDMKAVLAKLEAGSLDTNISVDAVAGMEGVADALAAVQARTSGGKIVIYPALGSVGMIRLPELATAFPDVAAALDDGRWTREAEVALLAAASPEGMRG